MPNLYLSIASTTYAIHIANLSISAAYKANGAYKYK